MDEQATNDTLISGNDDDELDESILIEEDEEDDDDEPELVHEVQMARSNSLESDVAGPSLDHNETSQPKLDNNIDHHSLLDDQLEQSGVEIVTVSLDDNERDQDEQLLETESAPLPVEPPQQIEAISLEGEMQELRVARDDLEIEQVDSLVASRTTDTEDQQVHNETNQLPEERPHQESTSNVPTNEPTQSDSGTSNCQMVIDDPVVETVQLNEFAGGSSAETILTEEDLREDLRAESDMNHDIEMDDLDLPATSLSTGTTDANTILDTDSSKDGLSECAGTIAASAEPEFNSDLFKNVKFAVCEDIDDLDKAC